MDIKLGKLIDPTTEAERDAIHVAVIPVRAPWSTELAPGTRVGLRPSGEGPPVASPVFEPKVGIIDPFLDAVVPPGACCWLLVFPGKAENLRHVWRSDDIPDERARPYVPDDDDGCKYC